MLKDVTFDNIKSHKKTGFDPIFKKCIFKKTTEGSLCFFVVVFILPNYKILQEDSYYP